MDGGRGGGILHLQCFWSLGVQKDPLAIFEVFVVLPPPGFTTNIVHHMIISTAVATLIWCWCTSVSRYTYRLIIMVI